MHAAHYAMEKREEEEAEKKNKELTARKASLARDKSRLQTSIAQLKKDLKALEDKEILRKKNLIQYVTNATGDTLHFQSILMGIESIDEIIAALDSILKKGTITTFDLSGSYLTGRSSEQIKRILFKLTSIKTLNISDNLLGEKTGADIAALFSAIPSGVTKIIVNGNKLGKRTGSELTQIFAAVPAGVKEIDLIDNDFEERTGKRFAWAMCTSHAFKKIPNVRVSTNTSKTEIVCKSGAEWAVDFAGLPKGLLQADGTVELSDHGLGSLSEIELHFIFSSLPEATQILDISRNQFSKRHVELIRILPTLPARIHTLNMASNELHQRSALEIAQIVAAIPAHIMKVNFNQNGLGSKNGVELIQIITAIPSHVTEVSLKGNDFLKPLTEKMLIWTMSVSQAFLKKPNVMVEIEGGTDKKQIVKSRGADYAVYLASFAKTRVKGDIFDLTAHTLGEIPTPELIQAFAAIPAECSVLKLCKNELHKKPMAELVQILAAIPAHIKTVDLSENALGSKTASELVQMLTAMPKQIQALFLDKNSLGSKSGTELAKIVGAIPAHITKVSLNENNLGSRNGVELSQMMTAIPTHVTEVSLKGNDFLKPLTEKTLIWTMSTSQAFLKKPDLMVEIEGGADKKQIVKSRAADYAVYLASFAKTRVNGEIFDLTAHTLGETPTPELVQAFAAIPVECSVLKLCKNELHKKLMVELVQILAAIPAHIKTVDLSENALGSKTAPELVQMLTSMPKHIKALHLDKNDLGSKSGGELAQIVAAIPLHIQEIHLSDNGLSKRAVTELIQVFAAIPKTVRILGINNNGLGTKKGTELSQVVAAVHSKLKELDMSMNVLDQRSGTELEQIFSSLPMELQRLNLTQNNLVKSRTHNLALVKIWAARTPVMVTFDDETLMSDKWVECVVQAELTCMVNRCNRYTSDKQDKVTAIQDLKSSLEQVIANAATYPQLLQYVTRALTTTNNPIFQVAFFKSSDVKELFEQGKILAALLETQNSSTASRVIEQPLVSETTYAAGGM